MRKRNLVNLHVYASQTVKKKCVLFWYLVFKPASIRASLINIQIIANSMFMSHHKTIVFKRSMPLLGDLLWSQLNNNIDRKYRYIATA